jgi:hypothetical protein
MQPVMVVQDELEELDYDEHAHLVDALRHYTALTFLTIPAISTLLSDQPIDRSTVQIPRNLQELDNVTFHMSAPTVVLLSTGSTLATLCVGQINLNHSKSSDLRLQRTRFGWIIGGSPEPQSTVNTFQASTTTPQTNLAHFWEIDEGPPTTLQRRINDVRNTSETTSNGPS